jgi:oxygen-independent coproporphyrinogen-3 oxidase
MLPRHVYVHVPFCARRCAYCDFAIAVRPRVPLDEYLTAVRRELELRYAGGTLWTADTLYLGGGTPSLLGGDGLARLLEVTRCRITLEAGCEVTLEANPDDVTPAAARAWRAAGITRVSIGAQSFHERALAWMRRTHSAEQIQRAVDAARDAGLDNISLDLIFALPAALGRDWRRDLDSALALAPRHLSLYGLTVEERTPLGRWRERGLVTEAPDETFEAEFLLAHDVLGAAGLCHYEVSNYALPGGESRHNCSYWQGRPYAGLGPSAHEFDGRSRRWNVAGYSEWARRLSRGEDPVGGSESLTEENRLVEGVYLGLRTRTGLVVDEATAELARPWIQAGWAELDGERLKLTPAGWLRMDAIACALTAPSSHS